jgi:hypothetical protein
MRMTQVSATSPSAQFSVLLVIRLIFFATRFSRRRRGFRAQTGEILLAQAILPRDV